MKTSSVVLFSRAVMAAVSIISVALVPAQAASVQPEVPNACALLSRLEVGQAAGTTVGEGELRLRTATLTRCMFARRDGANAALMVRRIPSGNWESEQRGYFQRGVQFGAYREMAGIGDRAFSRQIGQGSVLCVFVGEYYLQVSLFRMGEGSRASASLEKLARSALARLRIDNYGGTATARTSTASAVAAQR